MNVNADTRGRELTDEQKFMLLKFKLAESSIARIWNAFEEADLHPILIKGWAAARYYPFPFERHLGDIDLAFSEAEYEAAEEFREISGFTVTDIHRGLRHLDTADWDLLYARSETFECDGAAVRVLRAEDHLRVLAVHWLNDGGAYRDRLWDIAHLIEATRGSFDWELCFDGVSETRRRWVKTAVALAARHLGVDLGFVPFAAELEDIPDWLENALKREWDSGYRLVPLHFVLRDPKELIRQIRKRIPPNPIQSTVELEGEFDDGSRTGYQLRNAVRRISPSSRRVLPAIRRIFGGSR